MNISNPESTVRAFIKSRKAPTISANLKAGAQQTMDLNKTDLSARHEDTKFDVTSNRSIVYGSKWSLSSKVVGGKDIDSPYISESLRRAASIDSDQLVKSTRGYLISRMDSIFEGEGHIDSNLANFKSSEEYTGSFQVLSDIHENESMVVESSVTSVRFVDVNKKIGDRVTTYQKGTGAYQADELINTRKDTLAKDITLNHQPANYSYSPDRSINQSVMWSAGTSSGECGEPFVRTDLSSIKNLKEETDIDPKNIKTPADFTGKARLKAALYPQMNINNRHQMPAEMR